MSTWLNIFLASIITACLLDIIRRFLTNEIGEIEHMQTFFQNNDLEDTEHFSSNLFFAYKFKEEFQALTDAISKVALPCTIALTIASAIILIAR